MKWSKIAKSDSAWAILLTADAGIALLAHLVSPPWLTVIVLIMISWLTLKLRKLIEKWVEARVEEQLEERAEQRAEEMRREEWEDREAEEQIQRMRDEEAIRDIQKMFEGMEKPTGGDTS